MENIFDKLSDYTLSLKEALDSTNEANERPILTKHLAAAAEIFTLLHKYDTISAIEAIVEDETRAYGWSYLSGDAGKKVEDKWIEFKNAAGIK